MGYGISGGQMLFAAIVIALLGYGLIRGCEAGCNYVSDNNDERAKR